MDSFETVQKLNLHSNNPAETWKDFRQNFEICMLATESIDKPEPVKIAIFLKTIGPEAVKLYNTFKLSVEEKKCLDRIVDEFEKYFTKSRHNQMYDTYLFGKRRQIAGETFQAFVDDLKRMVKFCGFADESRMLRDRIVFGTLDRDLQKSYFAACEHLDLEQVIEMGRAAESERQKMAEFIDPKQQPKENFQVCVNCNLAHAWNMKCPAVGKSCKHCSEMHHYASACRIKRLYDEQLLADLAARYVRS